MRDYKVNQGIRSDSTIGNNIRRFRNEAGLTQDQLAAQMQTLGCDITRGTLAKIEAGIRHISVLELKAIREVLHKSSSDIFGG